MAHTNVYYQHQPNIIKYIQCAMTMVTHPVGHGQLGGWHGRLGGWGPYGGPEWAMTWQDRWYTLAQYGILGWLDLTGSDSP